MPSLFFMTPARRVFAGFAIYSFSMGNIFPRFGEVQSQMGVEEGAFGLGLIGAPVGTLIALTFAGPLLDRVGYRAALLTLIPLSAVFYGSAAFAPSPLALFMILFPAGLVIGCIEIILNLEADRVEHAVGYRIMNRAHAFWSFGFFSAGLFAAGLAAMGISPQMQVAVVMPVSIFGVWLLLSGFKPAPPRPQTSDVAAPRFAAPTWPILVLVSVTLSAMLMEGGSIDWGAIYMRDVFESGATVQALAVAAMAGSMTVARYVADGFVERYSPSAVARVLLGVLGVGCLTVVLSPAPALSLVGFCLIGIGCSVMFPLAMSAAAQRTDRPAAVNVAAFAQFSFMVFLLAPPILGFIAEHFGIRSAFAVGLPLILLSFLTVGALGGRRAVAAA
jgi:MFS family permease